METEKDYTHFPRLLKTNKEKEDFMNWIAFLQLEIIPKASSALEKKEGCCCLGVACYLTIPLKNLISENFDKEIMRGALAKDQPAAPVWLQNINADFQQRYGKALTHLNDGLKYSHPQIAELLLEVYGHEL